MQVSQHTLKKNRCLGEDRMMANLAVLPHEEIDSILDDVLADDPGRAAEVKLRLRRRAAPHLTCVPTLAAAEAEEDDLWDNLPV